MQQSHHDHIKPPSYYDNHDLNMYGLRRDREREGDVRGTTRAEAKEKLRVRAVEKSIQYVNSDDSAVSSRSLQESLRNRKNSSKMPQAVTDATYLMSAGRLDGGWGPMFNDGLSTFHNTSDPASWRTSEIRGFASTAAGRTPSLFLQELTHLASLCTAVAFSTLRNDIEGAESPLDLYEPGSPWPEADPDKVKKRTGVRSMMPEMDTIRYLCGIDKTPAERTKHNRLRPLPVLGGISDNEILFLQRARGPSAKVTLCWHWLSEFIIREHLAGSLGKVGPPIISRIIQFLSDGMIFYNHARKTTYIPFPFPHAQISAFFVVAIMFAVPLLMDEYSNDITLGSILTFMTVTCLAGLHEVARELENPFRNVPNEIPLCTLQAMFNESLIVLFSGFHPDHFWDGDEYRYDRSGDGDANNLNSPRTISTVSSSASGPIAPQADKGMSLAELKKVVSRQQVEIEKLSTLIETKSNGDSSCEPL